MRTSKKRQERRGRRKANRGGRSLSVAAIRAISRSASGRADSTGQVDYGFAEDSSQEGWERVVAVEPGAAGVFAELQQAEHCAESAAVGDHDVCCGAILSANHHATGDADGASGAQPGVGG